MDITKRLFLKSALTVGAAAMPLAQAKAFMPDRRDGDEAKRYGMLIDLRKCIGCTVLETYQTGTRALWHSAWLLPIMLFSAWAVAWGLTQFISSNSRGESHSPEVENQGMRRTPLQTLLILTALSVIPIKSAITSGQVWSEFCKFWPHFFYSLKNYTMYNIE